jgi:hypothetical protein
LDFDFWTLTFDLCSLIFVLRFLDHLQQPKIKGQSPALSDSFQFSAAFMKVQIALRTLAPTLPNQIVP